MKDCIFTVNTPEGPVTYTYNGLREYLMTPANLNYLAPRMGTGEAAAPKTQATTKPAFNWMDLLPAEAPMVMSDLKAAMRQKGMSDADIDQAILDASDKFTVSLLRHDFPAILTDQEKAGMVQDKMGNWYVGIARRESAAQPAKEANEATSVERGQASIPTDGGTEGVSKAAGKRATGKGVPESGGGGAVVTGREPESGSQPVAGERAGDGEAEGAVSQRRDTGTAAGSERGTNEPGEPVAADSSRTSDQPPSATALPDAFVITDPDAIIPRGQKGKLRANLDAIALLKRLTTEGRAATKEEQQILGQYTGFGQFPKLFDEYSSGQGSLAKEREELQALVTPEEYKSLSSSVLNAHYTSPSMITAMWDMARRLGFIKGRVLEPTMGVGSFFGLMPLDLRAASQLTGVEKDTITGHIASLLYPQPHANVLVKPLEEYDIPDNFFDFVIGNVPFGDFGIYDRAYARLGRPPIHDYAILKSLDKLRPGGVLMVITSTGTLDKQNDKFRRAMSERADLIAAMRLPDGIFEQNAGTSVVTDLVIFRKRMPGETADTSWLALKTVPDPDGRADIPINAYYAAHPEMVLGIVDRKSGMYGANQPHVSRTNDFTARLQRAIDTLPVNLYAQTRKSSEPADMPAGMMTDQQIDDLFNQALADVIGESPEVAAGESEETVETPKPQRPGTASTTKAPQRRRPRTATPRRGSATKAIKQAGKEAAEGLREAGNALNILFGDPNKLSSGFTFDEDSYRKAKPHFQAAFEHLNVSLDNLAEAARAFIEYMRDAHKWGAGQIQAAAPYMQRFLREWVREATATPTQQELASVRPGGLVVRGNFVMQRRGDVFVRADIPPANVPKMRKILSIRDALQALIDAQLDGTNTDAPRKALHQAYDAFVKEYGYLHTRSNAALMAGDPAFYLMQSLEVINPSTKAVRKADIFTQDVVSRARRVIQPQNIAEALATSLYESNTVNLPRIAGLLNRAEDDVARELVSKKLAFESPRGGWETGEQYLAGAVRRKLREAQAASQADPRYLPNVAALLEVQPEDVAMEDIMVRLGAPWVPASDIADFAAFLLKGDADHFKIQYSPNAAEWYADWNDRPQNRYAQHVVRESAEANQVYGTGLPKAGFIDILTAALNDKAITIRYKDAEGRSIVHVEETEEVALKVQDIKDAFADWVWSDTERAVRLHRYYNDNFNDLRAITYKGEHYKNADGKYTLPGMNPAMSLMEHQIKNVWHAVSTGRLLDASEVGAGKTFIMGSIAMEWRRLGMVKKPAIVVPKARLGGTIDELRLLYPGARILDFGRAFEGDKRQQVAAMTATGDYDLIIMTHEQLDYLPMRPETVKSFIEAEMDEVRARIAEEGGETSDQPVRGGRGGEKKPNRVVKQKKKPNRVVKQLEATLERLEQQLKEALDNEKRDNAVFFEETGIDALLVDEAHMFKALPVYSRRTTLKGVPTSRSQRATSMLMRTRWLLEQNQNRGVMFATGTPITNTLAELYNMQRYIQPQELIERGLDKFDAWADVFTEATTVGEFTAQGEYRPVTRLTNYVNAKELNALARQIMETNFVDDLPHITRPKKVEYVHKLSMSPTQKAYIQVLRKRAEALRGRRGKSTDNFLVISTDARKSAVSMRLVMPPDKLEGEDVDTKVEAVVSNVLRIHKARPGKTQMIFADMGVNPTEWGYSVYDDVIQRLVDGGIPRERIANFATLEGEKRQAAAGKLQEGEYWIAIGSTGKLGTGVNAQRYLTALHHLDIAWVPSAIEQRNGRGHRQHNTNKEVEVHYYVTEGTFDLVMWQAVARKLKSIQQFLQGSTARIIRMEDTGDEDSGELSPEMIMAAASGNPYALDQISTRQAVERLQRAEKAYKAQKTQYGVRLMTAQRELRDLRDRIDGLQTAATMFEESKGQPFAAIINDQSFTERKEAGKALLEYERDNKWNVLRDFVKVGTYRGFDLGLKRVNSSVTLAVRVPGDEDTVHRFNIAKDLLQEERTYQKRLQEGQAWIQRWLADNPGRPEQEAVQEFNTDLDRQYKALKETWSAQVIKYDQPEAWSYPPSPPNWNSVFQSVDNSLRYYVTELQGAESALQLKEKDIETAKRETTQPFKRAAELQAARERLEDLTKKIAEFEAAQRQTEAGASVPDEEE